MSNWSSKSAANTKPVALQDRPAPVSIYQNNVTVEGSWIEPLTITSQNNRTVSNVTLAMPHAGLVAAAALQDNHLLQVTTDTGSSTSVRLTLLAHALAAYTENCLEFCTAEHGRQDRCPDP